MTFCAKDKRNLERKKDIVFLQEQRKDPQHIDFQISSFKYDFSFKIKEFAFPRVES